MHVLLVVTTGAFADAAVGLLAQAERLQVHRIRAGEPWPPHLQFPADVVLTELAEPQAPPSDIPIILLGPAVAIEHEVAWLEAGYADYIGSDRLARLPWSVRRHVEARRSREYHQMEAVGRLAGGVAHEFNNLLAALVGSSEAALELCVDAAVRGHLEAILEATEQAATLTRQLLMIGHREVTAPRPTCINQVLEQLDPFVRRAVGEDVTLEVELAADLPAVMADPSLVEHAILNLASYARDAMPEGGTLTVRTFEVNGEIALEVIHTGTPLPPEARGHIFEPFYASGLGLSAVYALIHQLNGRIELRDTTFILHLPAVHPTPPTETVAAQPQQHTVLLVEDFEPVRRLTGTVLTSHGYRVLLAAHADEAMERVQNEPHIDLLLTDVVMPGLNGRELAERLQQRYQDLKVIFMSGYTDDEMLRRGVRSGEVPFLPKPFTRQDLLTKVAEVLGLPPPEPKPSGSVSRARRPVSS